MHQMKKQLTDAERAAITAKYERRVTELAEAYFGPMDEIGLRPPDAKSVEFDRRIIDATIQLLETVPPDYAGTTPHRKPGDLKRTAERLRKEEVDLPDPALDREEEAARFDQHAEFERSKIDFGHEMDAVGIEALEGLLPILLKLKEFAIDLTHLMKEWAQEDPDGPGAVYYRDFNRALKKGAGRQRV